MTRSRSRSPTICSTANEALDAEAAELFGDGGEPSQADQEDFIAAVLVPSIQGQIEAIRTLGEPEEGAEELDTVLTEAEDALEEVEDDPSVLAEGSDPFQDINDQMKELGAPACAS